MGGAVDSDIILTAFNESNRIWKNVPFVGFGLDPNKNSPGSDWYWHGNREAISSIQISSRRNGVREAVLTPNTRYYLKTYLKTNQKPDGSFTPGLADQAPVNGLAIYVRKGAKLKVDI